MQKILFVMFLMVFTCFLKHLSAQSVPIKEDVRTRILFLLDASGSMQNSWSDRSSETKIYSAKKILTEIVDSLSEDKNVELALRVYGHQ